MELFSKLFLIAFILVWLYLFITKVAFTWFDHSYNKKGDLKPDAAITSVTPEKYKAGKNDVKIKTTVMFSDGFVFVTFKTNRENRVLSYTISTDKDEIIRRAQEAHQKAYLKLNK